jgi:hypothetical protein
MRNRSFALVAYALVAALAACAERPRPAPTTDPLPPSDPPRQLATFTVTYEPPGRGPGLGGPRGTTLWNVIPTGTGLGPDANPPRTIQLRSTDPLGFQLVEGALGACTTRYITVPVEIKNFFPERLVDIYVVLTGSDTGNGLCDPGAQPQALDSPANPDSGGNPVTWPAPPAHQNVLGYLNYVTPDQYPRLSLAGSLEDTGTLEGGSFSFAWAFNYGNDTPFTIYGEVWADPFPNAPRAWGGFGWLNHAEPGEFAFWGVYDRKDNWEFPLQGSVPTHLVWIYDGYDSGTGTCTGTALVSAKSVNSSSAGVSFTNFNMFLPDTTTNLEYPGTTLTPGQQYCFRAVNVWTPAGAAGPVTGSFYMNEPFIATSRPQLIPTASPLVGDSATFSWTVVAPAKTDYVEYPASLAFFRICSAADCTDPGDPIIVGGGTNFGTEPNNLITGVDNLDGSWTFEVTPTITALGPGTYFWSARNALEGRQGNWADPLSFDR